MASFTPLQSVTRTMAVLVELNKRTFTRVQDLQQATSLPGPTIVRILETLIGLGYLEKEARRVGYKLTIKVQELSLGYSGMPEYLDLARPVLLQLTQEIVWPVALASLDELSMIVRLSTIPESPLAHARSTQNKRLELLTRAHGRAYLAFCTEGERNRLFEKLSKTEVIRLSAPQIADRMLPILEDVRSRGYAERAHEVDPQTSTIAVAVRDEDRIVATIGVTFFKGSRPNRRHLATKLREAAHQIGTLISEA